MSDIKSVLSLLCQHLSSSINVTIKPEYFRLAKFNGTAEHISEAFWKTLNILSYYAVKEKQIEIDFQQHDIVRATKLHFAYLQYSAVEFYALNQNSKNNRALLIAFAWILGTQNVLNIVTRVNMSSSVLGKECSYSNELKRKEIECTNNIPESLTAQINHVLYLNGKVNYNIKEISELTSERTKSISKVHAATLRVGGLPHLSISEAALIKHISMINKNTLCSKNKKHMRDLRTIAAILDIHMKWLKKEHIFFEWMVTVIEEHNKSLSIALDDANCKEILQFVSLLNYVIEENLAGCSSKKELNNSQGDKCISRLLRVQGNNAEVENWLTEISVELGGKIEDSAKEKEELLKKLQEILKLIPSSLQI